jgi:hypothetical protein
MKARNESAVPGVSAGPFSGVPDDRPEKSRLEWEAFFAAVEARAAAASETDNEDDEHKEAV